MSAAWDCGDFYLATMLEKFLGFEFGNLWTLHLFKNDYTPHPGTVDTDFVEADYPGYAYIVFDASDFGAITVTAHVAQSTLSAAQVFTGDTGSWSPQTIYGYWILNNDDNYYVSERFNTPIDMIPDGQISITPRLKHATFPY